MQPIIVIDDDPVILELMKDILEEEGYSFFLFHTLPSPQTIYDISPCVVLLDIVFHFKIEETIQLCKEISKSTHVLLFTAFMIDEKTFKETQAKDILKKPFDLLDLLGILKKYCV